MLKVYYHNDMDGYGSAYALWKVFKETATYIPIDYGDGVDIQKGDEIYFVDFSLKRPEMMKHLKVAHEITVIDHHKTAQDALDRDDDPANFIVTFDMSKSAAVLCWEYFHMEEVPIILKHIQDHDLWKFKVPKTEEVSAYLHKYIYLPLHKTFRDLDELPSMNEIYKEGEILLDVENKKIQEILKTKYEVQFEGYKVGVVDSNHFASKLGNKLAQIYPFGIVRGTNNKNENTFIYGLRSVGDFDVSEIAKKYGGGGHQNASGFEQPKNKKIFN